MYNIDAMGRAALLQIRIDEATWSQGSPDRRHEWRLAINEILEEGWYDGEAEGLEAHVLIGSGKVRFELRRGAEPVATHELPLGELQPFIDEYINTCREMTKLGVGTNSPRLEALDIAKRLTHDEAGELVARTLSSLKPDHATGRRIFTLLVTLFHDTTKLAAPPHRVRYE